MQFIRVVHFICVIALCAISFGAAAKEITLQHKGLTLNADFEFAVGKTVADEVVLITHGGLAHRDMETIAYLRKLFKDGGYNTLAINLSLGLNNRTGMYDCKLTHRHKNDDAVDEIGLWVDWLKAQGVLHISLLGHSRGAAQTALYAAERDSDQVKAVVLLAPATEDNTNAVTYQQRYDKPLTPLLQKAQQLVRNGKANTVLEKTGLLTCRDTSVTADTFISYYGQDPRLDTPYLIPKIRKPLLVVVAGNDKVVIDLEHKIAPYVDGKQVQMTVIEGADHMFRDLFADYAVEAISEFLMAIILPEMTATASQSKRRFTARSITVDPAINADQEALECSE